MREQTQFVLERIKAILDAAGTSLDNVLTVTTHLTRREDLAAYNEEYNRYFPDNKPARTTVGAMLNMPELLVEITVTACSRASRRQRRRGRYELRRSLLGRAARPRAGQDLSGLGPRSMGAV